MDRLLVHLSEIRLTLESDISGVIDALAAVWGGCALPLLPPRCEHTLSARVERGRVVVRADGDQVDGCESVADALPVLDRAIYDALPGWLGAGRVALHAAGFCVEGVGVLVAGQSGAGKSSLSLAALERGYHYASDEICVTDGLRVWGLPRSVLFDGTPLGDPLPGWIRGADCDRYRFEGRSGEPYCLPLRAVPDAQRISAPWPVEVTHVVLAGRGEHDALDPADPVAALAALLEGRWGDATVNLAALVHSRRAWRLTWSEPASALRLLSQTLGMP